MKISAMKIAVMKIAVLRVSLSLAVILGLAACVAPAMTAPGAPSLAGRTFVAQVEDEIAAEQRPRLEFLADGRLAGYTGCNALSGGWSESDGVVLIGALAMTKRACVGAGDGLERRFLAAVNPKARIELAAGGLVAHGADGAHLQFAERSR